jgi:hypothetical protein
LNIKITHISINFTPKKPIKYLKALHIIAHFLSNKSKLWLCLVTLILFVIITSVRFNRNNAIVNRPLNDARYFIAYVEHFRGEIPSDVIRPASNWRMLVPFVAAILPLEPLTAINIINQLLLLLSMFMLYISMLYLKISKGYVWLGLMLFSVSFPAFYYTTIGYVDAGVMFFVSTCIYATLKQSWWLFMVSFVLGFFAKESIVVVLPFGVVYLFMQGKRKHAIALGLILITTYLAESYWVRHYAYLTPGEKNNMFWVINPENIGLNLKRINSLLAPILTLGLVGLIYLFSIKSAIKTNKALTCASLLLLATTLAMYTFAFITTYADGRPFWLAYFAMIIVSMIGLQSKVKQT